MTGKEKRQANLLKGNERGQGWKPGQSGNLFGKPQLVFSQIQSAIKEAGYEPVTEKEVREAYSAVQALPMAEVIRIRGEFDEKGSPIENGFPMLYRNAAQIMLGKDRLRAFTEFHNRMFRAGGGENDYTPPTIQITVLPSNEAVYRSEADIPDGL
jgi:hypothetical protein